MKRDECSPQEQWVLERLEQGQIADLRKQYGEVEEKRRISAKFLEALLTDKIALDSGNFTPHRRGIFIIHAVVGESLDLTNAAVAHIVCFIGCIFKRKVICRDARYARHLVLDGCHFLHNADFHRVKVEFDLFCRGAVFQKVVNFGGVYTGGQFSTTGAKFNSPDQEANFNSLKVGQDASFSKVVFQGPVNFIGADIGRQFNALGAHFSSANQIANFSSLKVGQTAFFQGAQFHGPVDFSFIKVQEHFDLKSLKNNGSVKATIFEDSVDFSWADIGGQFNAKGVQFLSQEKEANFNSLRVGQDAFFQHATFQGPVDFNGAKIIRQFNAQGAQFKNDKEENNFNYLEVGQSAVFDNGIFHGPVNFKLANIGNQLSANRACFICKDQLADFNATKVGKAIFFQNATFEGPVEFMAIEVGQHALFDNASFHGPVVFRAASIGGYLVFNGVQFHNEKEMVNFESLKVGESAFFVGTEFSGPVALNRANLLDLKMSGKFIPELDLESALIDRELLIENTEINKIMARNLTVQGQATLEKVTIVEKADFRYARFQALDLKQVNWPPERYRQEVRLEGIKFSAISAGEKQEQRLLSWLEGARFNTQPYQELEGYYLRRGEKKLADDVFLVLKRREVKEHPSFWKNFWTEFLILLVGYGRRPQNVLYWSLILLLLGLVIFSNENWMVPKEASARAGYASPVITETISKNNQRIIEEGRKYYSLFIYPLDLFLPVDLEMAKYYEPDFLVGKIYARFLIIAGWVLIAALAAAYTGLFELKMPGKG